MAKDTIDIIEAIFNAEEVEIYNCDSVRDLIDYKWRAFAQRSHRMGAFAHLCYIIVLMLYINEIFLN